MTFTPLFWEYDLLSVLRSTEQKMLNRLESWDQDALLSASEHDVVETLTDLGSVECPRLRRDEAEMERPKETTQQFMEFGRQIERRVPALTLVVPFDGESDVFRTKPSTVSSSPPLVERLAPGQLHITVEGQLVDGDQVRANFDQQLDRIEQWLGWAREDIDRHNAKIRDTVPGVVARRRAELLTIRDVQAAVGYPIRKRADAAAYSVPVKRRTLRPASSAPPAKSTRFVPEPVLTEQDYEAALEVLRHSRNALERTPSLAAGMDEETFRNLLLVFLNAQFEGTASGEVFNCDGKTDILIRERDGNVFIGECKIWAGPKTVSGALDQVLRYMAWRDTKAALLVFIRNKDVSAAIRSAVEAVEAHPNYKRRGRHDSVERADFVLHANGDVDREIHLALLPFALPGDATSRFSR
ncbi:hypothetical protein [Nonomuraea sp. NPDC049646]|uniref:hypothetical protein n=1 Tax=unclassified Nonomuraea TaxID=2593643 RepID=UPI0037ACF8FA